MFQKFRLALKAVVLAAFWTVLALPALAQTQTGTFSIQNSQSLQFGRIVGGTGGSVTISTAGARTASGDVTLLNSTSSAASFTVSCTEGPAGSSACTTSSYYSFNPVANTSLVSGSNTMALTNFSIYSVNDPLNRTGGRLISGSDTLKVGATLTVGSSQPAGSYLGSFSVTVNYP